MHVYPPEYDAPEVSDIGNKELMHCLPSYVDGVYWEADGCIFITSKTKDEVRSLANLDWDDNLSDEDNFIKARGEVLLALQGEIQTYHALSAELLKLESDSRAKGVTCNWEDHWAWIKENVTPKDGVGVTVYVDDSEAGDWQPEWCSYCNAWHSYAYAFDYERDEDGDYIKIGECDSDGDWNYTHVYEDEYNAYFWEYFNTDRYFLKWAEYWLWCADNGGIDPLDQCLTKISVEFCLKAADDNLNYVRKDMQ